MVYLVIEYNWNQVGGVFSSKEEAKKWCEECMDFEPNLMWEVHPFEMNKPISMEEAARAYRES